MRQPINALLIVVAVLGCVTAARSEGFNTLAGRGVAAGVAGGAAMSGGA